METIILKEGKKINKQTVWGHSVYTITKVTDKCVFCKCVNYIDETNDTQEELKETRFQKDYFIKNVIEL